MAVKVGELYQELQLKDDKFNKGMKNAKNKSSMVGKALTGLAGGAVAGLGAAFVSMAKTGTENMKQIDDATQNFRSETGASQKQAEEFSNTIQKLHKQNTDSYRELGDAVTALRQRHGEESKGMEQDFLDYAKVTGQETDKAVEDLHSLQKAWGKDLSEMTGVMDSLKAISAETGAPVEDLQKTLSELAPVAKANGQNLDEAAAMLGQFQKNGVPAQKATRGMRKAMEALENPTKNEAAALDKLGVETMPQLMEKMSDGIEGSDEMSAALEILGKRSGTEMVTAMKNGEAGIEEMMGVIKNSEGTVSEASEQYDKKLGERWTLIRRKYLEPFMEAIGEQLLSALEGLLDFAEKWGPKLENVFGSISDFVGNVFGSNSETSEKINEMQNTMNSAFSDIETIINQFVKAARIIWESDFGQYFKDTLRALFDMLGTIIESKIEVLTSALSLVANAMTGDWEGVKEDFINIFETMWEELKTILGTIWDGILKKPFNSLINSMTDVFDEFKPVEKFRTGFNEVMTYLTDDLPKKMIEQGKNLIEGMAKGISENVGIVGDAIKNMAEGSVIGKVANKLGLFSPSKVFMQYGNWLMEGLAIGIENNSNKPGSALDDMINMINGKFNNISTGTVDKPENLLIDEKQIKEETDAAEKEVTEMNQSISQKFKQLQNGLVNTARKSSEKLISIKRNRIVKENESLLSQKNQQKMINKTYIKGEREREQLLTSQKMNMSNKETEKKITNAHKFKNQHNMINNNMKEHFKKNILEQSQSFQSFTEGGKKAIKNMTTSSKEFWKGMGNTFVNSTQNAFSSILRGTKSVAESFKDIWKSVIDQVIQKLAAMAASKAFNFVVSAASGGAGGFLGNIISGIGSFLSFDKGGIVPGAFGKPKLAVVHGGEEVLTPEQRMNNQQKQLSQKIEINATYNVSDQQTAEQANDDLIRKLQGRGLAGAYR
ncbi:MAG: phage tail tape measure protein [Bacillota bacterium]